MPRLRKNTINDHNLHNGLMTKVWGPAGWLFLHCVTFGYPINPEEYDLKNGNPPGYTKNWYTGFFESVGHILPCKYCRQSYLEYLINSPVKYKLNSRDELVEWLWEIHNEVNKKLGITYCDSSLKEVKVKYEAFRAKCKATTPSEREKKKELGCITPVDGKPKHCKINIIEGKSIPDLSSFLTLIIGILIGILLSKYILR